MKGNHPAALRALYIVLVPVVLVIILLNSGFLQRLVPAATVHGETYSVVRYNFYYFDYYNLFLEAEEDNLAELGYDPELPDSDQLRSDGRTWKEFFQAEAERNLIETAYFYDLAQQNGYSFSESELAPIAQTLAKQEAQRLEYGISAGNYYISYYGAGMDETRYEQELTRQVKARAYRAHLEAIYEPGAEELAQWLAAHPQTEYRSVYLSLITLDALPDRATGHIGPAQVDALSSKLALLVERYEQGCSFEDLQAAFSTVSVGPADGRLAQARRSELPQAVADWCLNDQDALQPGDTFALVEEASGCAYFARLDGFGPSGPELDAAQALGCLHTANCLETAADYEVVRNSFRMLLATT